jgi:NADPH:quinone reductase-like Zn-dependent oxidoreductase
MKLLHIPPFQIPDNISFDEAASVPLCIFTAAVGLYDSPSTNHGVGLTPPWEPSGAGKYKGQGILVIGGSSSVGQFG